MKRKLIPLILALTLVLCGCTGGMIANPKTVDGGVPWEGSWTNLGGLVGVEQPGGEFELLTSNGRLEGLTIQYATWVCGAETVLEDDKSVFEGQIYLMTESCGTAVAAAATLEQWHSQFGTGLQITRREQITVGGQEYELLHYDCTDPQLHFSRGAAVLWQRGDLVLVADLAAAASLDLDLTATMEHFLSGIHYAD